MKNWVTLLITVESALLLFALLITGVVQVSVADKVAVFDLGQLLAGALFWTTLGTWCTELGSALSSGIFIGNNGYLTLLTVINMVWTVKMISRKCLARL